jgi:O-antigen ligase
MWETAGNRYLGMYVLLTSVAVCLFISPINSIDPVNLPKLSLLIVFAFVAAGFVVAKVDFLKDGKSKPVLILTGLFILQLFLVLLVDNRDFALKFYGIYGRNTGFAAYLSLIFLFIASVASGSVILLKRYLISLVAAGGLLALYGIAQSKGYDFYQFDLGIGTKTFGSFGNSNFHSAFMGITAASATSIMLFSRIKIYNKALLLFVTGLSIYNISLSSQQGYLNFAAGVAAAGVIFLLKSKRPILGWIALALSSATGLLVLFGLLNQGPLADAIYKSSLQARNFYWRAAFNMMLEHPLFGVGMDGYGDWYMRARPQDYLTSSFTTVSDTAHSVPLDIGSNGGFPLFLIYLGIIVLVLTSIVRIMKRNSGFDVIFTSIVSAWVAYQAQSLISINQLGLGVWGWSLSGLIIGYELKTRPDEKLASPQQGKKGRPVHKSISALAVVSTFIMTGSGIAIALPPYLAAGKFYKALQSGDANVIESAAYIKPLDRFRVLYVAQILQENKLESNAIAILRDASILYPDSSQVWTRWAGIASASPSDVARAKAQMKRLDPYSPDL